MVGGKREEVPVAAITSSNIFSALEKKKKSKKPKDAPGKKDGKKAKQEVAPAPELWQAAPIQVASWADCEDDDDFGGLGPVPQWGNDAAKVANEAEESRVPEEESDEEIEALQHGEEEHDEHDDERDAEEGPGGDAEEEDSDEGASTREPPTAVSAAPREPERQLSKKELKKKEMEDLEKVLAELGIQANAQSNGVAPELKSIPETKDGAGLEEGEEAAGGDGAMQRTKSKKMKKKKDKNEMAEEGGEAAVVEGESKGDEPSEEAEALEEGPLLDPKEALKKLKSQKSTKKGDSVAARAKAAIEEAAKRKAKLAKAKSKDKSHYNQQPVR